jgi:hypothetical protein
VNKPDVPKPEVLSVCPSCGLLSADGPHGTSEECIRSLEAEIHRLSELVTRVKRQAPKKKG